MKRFFNTAFCFFLFAFSFTESSFYNFQFESIEGSVVKTSSFRGKKVVIAVVSAEQKSIRMIEYLDSTQKANDSVRVIAIPTGDFKGNVNTQAIKDLKKRISIIVTKPMKVTRENGTKQHALFSWLTKSAENSHYNMDVSGEGHLFVVSAQGTLYSVLPNQTPERIITRVIHQSFTK